MATIAINGTTLQPQPARTSWEDAIVAGKLDGTDHTGAYKIFRMQAPNIKSQVFNWDSFENQVLVSLTAYAVGDVFESANVTFSSGVVSKKISQYQSPLDNSNTGIELIIQVIDDGGGS